jgi:protein N-terminal methyltransferase
MGDAADMSEAAVQHADSLINSSDSIAYWNKTPSTVDGMLGGFPQVSRIDITGSRTFLVKLLRISNPCSNPPPGKKL